MDRQAVCCVIRAPSWKGGWAPVSSPGGAADIDGLDVIRARLAPANLRQRGRFRYNGSEVLMSEKSDIADRRQRDFDDLQNEATGRDVGRISRFLAEGDARSAEAKRRKAEREQTRRSLALLLEDPIYRARYETTWDALRQAEMASDRALDHLAEKITHAASALQDMKDDAARLPDGTMVFRDETGMVRRADGSAIGETLAATILWDGNEPSYEDYVAARERLASLEDAQRSVERYQTDVLGAARERLDDEDNPPSLEGLDAILGDIEARMPDQVRQQLPDAERVEPTARGVAVSMVPDLGSSR